MESLPASPDHSNCSLSESDPLPAQPYLSAERTQHDLARVGAMGVHSSQQSGLGKVIPDSFAFLSVQSANEAHSECAGSKVTITLIGTVRFKKLLLVCFPELWVY